jgi:hypothetical protein
MEDPFGQLERNLIDEFVRARGYDLHKIDELPELERMELLKAACAYASARLAEVEARFHYVHEIHDGSAAR